jgi:hypothetical protein
MHKAIYSVLRYIPDVPREEFVNVGVLLICPELKFQKVLHIPSFGDGSKAKLLMGSDGQFVRHAVGKLARAIENLSINELLGHENPKTLLSLQDLHDLSRIYAANNIQLTPPRSAATVNPEVTLQEIYGWFVAEPIIQKQSNTVNRARILRDVSSQFRQQGLFDAGVQEDWVVPVGTKSRVDLAYQNHVWHCYQAIPFEIAESRLSMSVNAYRSVKRDAQESRDAPPEVQAAKFSVLTLPPKNPQPRVADLIALLKDEGFDILDYRDTGSLTQSIAKDLQAHSPLSSSLRVN